MPFAISARAPSQGSRCDPRRPENVRRPYHRAAHHEHPQARGVAEVITSAAIGGAFGAGLGALDPSFGVPTFAGIGGFAGGFCCWSSSNSPAKPKRTIPGHEQLFGPIELGRLCKHERSPKHYSSLKPYHASFAETDATGHLSRSIAVA